MIHSGEKPFKCDYPNCERRFRDKSNLNIHFKKHFKNESFENNNSLKYDNNINEKINYSNNNNLDSSKDNENFLNGSNVNNFISKVHEITESNNNNELFYFNEINYFNDENQEFFNGIDLWINEC